MALDFRDQYFGCEIEMTGLTRQQAARTLAELFGAETAAEIAVTYGSFIAVVLDFLIIALVLFMVVKAINKLRSIGKKPEEPVEEAAPAPTSEELLTEIRDLLKDKQ